MAPRKKETEYVLESSLFDNLYIIEDIDTAPKEKAKLDIFTQILPALNSGNYNFYSELSDDEKKLYQPYVIFRWLSGVKGNSERDYIQNVNDFVNVDFWTLSKHPELQHKLMCLAARLSNNFTNKRQQHQWLNFMGTKRKKSAINDFLLGYYPNLRDDELELFKVNTSYEQFEEFLTSRGFQDSDMKKYLKAWKDDMKARK